MSEQADTPTPAQAEDERDRILGTHDRITLLERAVQQLTERVDKIDKPKAKKRG